VHWQPSQLRASTSVHSPSSCRPIPAPDPSRAHGIIFFSHKLKVTTMGTTTFFTYLLFTLGVFGVSGVHAKGSVADLQRMRSAKGGALHPGSSASSRIGAPAVNVAPAPGKSVVFAPLSFKKDDFAVDGSKIPLLKEKLQDSYAGQLPVTADEGEKRVRFARCSHKRLQVELTWVCRNCSSGTGQRVQREAVILSQSGLTAVGLCPDVRCLAFS